MNQKKTNMKIDLETDEFGNVTNIRYHDGHLIGLTFEDAYFKSLNIFAEPAEGEPYKLECLGVEGFLASEFRNGSGIFDMYQWESSEVEGKKIATKLNLVDNKGEILTRVKGKLCLKIECIDDCEIFVVCNSIKYISGGR